MLTEILDKIYNKDVTIGVIGLGYVGLPLCLEFSKIGIKTLGFDIDHTKVESITAKRTYIKHISDNVIAEMVDSGAFSATSDFNRLNEPDAILITVPTPLNKSKDPDLSFITTTCEAIARRLRKKQLIVLESTTYPGTTSAVVKPLLDKGSGLSVDNLDYFLAFSPEREDPNRQNFSTKTIPKVVGGYNPESLQFAEAIYRLAIDTIVPVSSCEVAEASKILENTYRSVNIALVNELKMLFDRMNIDIWEVIEAAKTKPFGFSAFYPGPGLGGHCIPIDPFYLSWRAKEFEMPTRFIELAGEINTAMPEWVVNKVIHALNDKGKPVKESKILILGMAYKPNVDDDRESPSFKLMKLLEDLGGKTDYYDPYIPVLKKKRDYPQFAGKKGLASLNQASLEKFDCVLIATNHSAIDYDFICKHADLVVDTRNACVQPVVKA